MNASANFRFRKHKDIQRQTTVTMYDWAGEKSTPDGLPDYSLGTGTVNSQTGTNDLWVKNTLNDSRYQVYNAFITYNNTFKEDHTLGVMLTLIHIRRCRRTQACRSRWSPYH